MDQRRFDDLARNLGANNSRRAVLKGLLAGVAGTVGLLGGGALAAKGGGSPNKPDCCPSTAPRLCNNTCVDFSSDPNNCGACGVQCTSGESCVGGQCAGTCTPNCAGKQCGDDGCGGTCGACAGAICVGSNTLQQASTCNAEGTCDAGATVSCGSYLCASGACLSTCSTSSECAAGNCCQGGICAPVNILSDVSNCGACGHVCFVANGAAACVNGTCEIAACNPGFADCNGNPADGCETDVFSDPSNCGACGHLCPSGVCSNGVCA